MHQLAWLQIRQTSPYHNDLLLPCGLPDTGIALQDDLDVHKSVQGAAARAAALRLNVSCEERYLCSTTGEGSGAHLPASHAKG